MTQDAAPASPAALAEDDPLDQRLKLLVEEIAASAPPPELDALARRLASARAVRSAATDKAESDAPA